MLRYLANDPFYGLTDDGDFAILGVNVEEETTTDNANKNGGEQRLGSDLSSLLSVTSFSGLSNDNLKSSTAGSIDRSVDQTAGAVAGIGTGDAISINDALFGRLPSRETRRIGTIDNGATMKGSPNLIEDSAVSTLDKSPKPRKIDSASSYADEESLIDIQEWLLTVIPKLSEHDVEVYARGLNSIGFHPECVTVCEMNYEDMDFMKVLHRRYLFNEVTGIEHPWEV